MGFLTGKTAIITGGAAGGLDIWKEETIFAYRSSM